MTSRKTTEAGRYCKSAKSGLIWWHQHPSTSSDITRFTFEIDTKVYWAQIMTISKEIYCKILQPMLKCGQNSATKNTLGSSQQKVHTSHPGDLEPCHNTQRVLTTSPITNDKSLAIHWFTPWNTWNMLIRWIYVALETAWIGQLKARCITNESEENSPSEGWKWHLQLGSSWKLWCAGMGSIPAERGGAQVHRPGWSSEKNCILVAASHWEIHGRGQLCWRMCWRPIIDTANESYQYEPVTNINHTINHTEHEAITTLNLSRTTRKTWLMAMCSWLFGRLGSNCLSQLPNRLQASN